ncbi:Nn.00g010550.m01.CDS01 [Neocucurbitaria sp. VM-36]
MADDRTLIVIVGINSRQGSSIARRFASRPRFELRGTTTNISSARSQSWLAEGVTLVQIDNYRDTTAIGQALQGATAIFAVTDFYRHLNEHSTLTLADVWKKSPEEVAAQREIAEGKAIVAAAAAVQGLKLFVLSSLSPAYGEMEDAPGLQQFHSKAEIVQYMDISFPNLGRRASLLKPAMYMEEWTKFLRRNTEGRFTFGTTLPAAAPIPWTHIADDIATLFQLCMASPPRLNVAAVSDIRSGAEICHLFTETTRIPCDYVQYTAEELGEMLGPRGHITVDMLGHIFQRQYYEACGIQLSHHLIKGRPDAHKFPLTTLGDYMKASLPAYLEQYLGTKEVARLSTGSEAHLSLWQASEFQGCVDHERGDDDEGVRRAEVEECGGTKDS